MVKLSAHIQNHNPQLQLCVFASAQARITIFRYYFKTTFFIIFPSFFLDLYFTLILADVPDYIYENHLFLINLYEMASQSLDVYLNLSQNILSFFNWRGRL